VRWRSWPTNGSKRKTKVIGVSVDSVEDHEKWKRDIETVGGAAADFPIIDDSSLTVAKAYDMLPADYYLPTEGRTPAIRPPCAPSISSGRTRRCG
jgi:alkyl hydroperoxide reductase subunit AhpC